MSVSNEAREQLSIDHIAIAVRELEPAIEHYRDRLGFELIERRETQGESSGMISAVMRQAGVTFVLLQGLDAQSQVGRFVDAYGPGVHHIALHAGDLLGVVDEMKGRGVDFSTRVVTSATLEQTFTVRDPNSGVMLELIRRGDNPDFDDANVAQLFRDLEQGGAI